MKNILIIYFVSIFSFAIAQPYITSTVQVNNTCTTCCNSTISFTINGYSCPSFPPVQVGIQSISSGTTILWGASNLSNVCNGTYTVIIDFLGNSTCGAFVACSLYYPVTTSIISNEETSVHFFVYPNPANDILNISFDLETEFTKVEIFNNLGQLIREQEISLKNRNASINTDQLPNGVYLLNLKSEVLKNSTTVGKRFVIAK
ncbi:MAG: T9SS type A sorting domain-containing protein [Bacteroidetes bacterium]|nr:T9SS type A sorting domain-containing protein [Bacteroidota bacterium]